LPTIRPEFAGRKRHFAAKSLCAYLDAIKLLGLKVLVVYRMVFGIIVLLLAFLHLGTAR